MGGYIAFAMFRHAPRYFRGLVLADTRAQADTPEGVDGRKRMLAAGRSERAPAAVADEMLPKLLGETTRATRPDVVERVRAADPGELGRDDRRRDPRADDAARFDAAAADDSLSDADHRRRRGCDHAAGASEEMQRGDRRRRARAIPARRTLSNLEQPDAFNAALARFLDHRV